MRYALTFLAIVLTSTVQLSAQSSNGETAPYYLNVNGGFGMLYGGFGGNVELGKSHFSTYASLGYATKRVIDTFTLASSVNYQVGLRYYINANSDIIFPRVGVGFGWITNYYHEDIGSADYDHHVQGINAHVGVQFYTVEGLVFNLDVAGGSKAVITNAKNHPYFYNLYVRPTIGIGVDLTQLLGKGNKSNHIKNKEINPLG